MTWLRPRKLTPQELQQMCNRAMENAGKRPAPKPKAWGVEDYTEEELDRMNRYAKEQRELDF